MKFIAMTAAALCALAVAACQSTSTDDTTTAAPPAPSATPAEPAAPPEPTTPPPSSTSPQAQYSDEQLRSFVRTNTEVSAIASRHQSQLQGTPEQQAAAREQIQSEALPVLQRNNLDIQTYNAIATAARTDPAVQARIAALRANTPGG